MFHKQTRPTTGGQILLLDRENILPNPFAIRSVYDEADLDSLAQSMRKSGMLQPIHVRPCGELYEVILGERRLRAARVAGLLRIPCLVMELSDRQAALYAASENLQHRAPNLFEQAKTIELLLGRFQYTQEEVAIHLGLSLQAISDKQRLLRLPEDIQQTICKTGLSESQALCLLRLPHNELRESALREIIKNRLSEKQTGELVRELLQGMNKQTGRPKLHFQDIRIFTNTIDHAITTMKDAGIAAESIKKEARDYVEYTIRIPLEREDAKKKPPAPEIQLVK